MNTPTKFGYVCTVYYTTRNSLGELHSDIPFMEFKNNSKQAGEVCRQMEEVDKKLGKLSPWRRTLQEKPSLWWVSPKED